MANLDSSNRFERRSAGPSGGRRSKTAPDAAPAPLQTGLRRAAWKRPWAWKYGRSQPRKVGG